MSLQLDARRRAMLAEMRMPFWWPRSEADGASSAPRKDGMAAAAYAAGTSTSGPASAPATAPAVVVPAPAASAAPADAAPAPVQRNTEPGALLHAPGVLDGMDWPALRAAVLACTACGLCEGRTAPVFTIDPLPTQADWLIVGEPPDEHEERAGAPFVGSTGQLLDNMLRAVQCTRDGRGRAGARVTSVVKCRPAVARNPDADELARCAVYLRREIALTQPRVIVAMGRFAALSLLAPDHPSLLRTPFGQLRGKLYRSHGLPVVVTYHPSKLLRAPLEKAAAWADLCLARAQVLASPASTPPPTP